MDLPKIILILVCGLAGGIFGGMGMGGGTVLIPLITIFCGVEQHAAQAVNLVSFIPMAVVALIFHIKNKLVEFKPALWLIIPALISSIGAGFWANVTESGILRKCFGGFLIALAVYSIISMAISFFSRKNKAPSK